VTEPSGQDLPHPGDVLVVGAGLIGTSAGLALRRAGRTVWLHDADPATARLAADLGAGAVGMPDADPTVVLVCAPPSSIAENVHRLQQIYVSATFSDVASAKTEVLLDIDAFGCDLSRFVGGHPLAGREKSGPSAAQADLFDGRPWVLCPTPETSVASLAAVKAVVRSCGASPIVTSWEEHDRAVALVSHLPQVLASAMAAQLGAADEISMALAGQGLRDMIRIAGSDPALWDQILASNAVPLLGALDGLVDDLAAVQDELRKFVANEPATRPGTPALGESVQRQVDIGTQLPRAAGLIERGRAGRARLPGKHGASRVDFSTVQVVIADRPGELARLLVASGDAGVNIEDVAIEHSPGQPVGLVELSVRPEFAQQLASALAEAGWTVHG
jgi:prephenate dehydrogenase